MTDQTVTQNNNQNPVSLTPAEVLNLLKILRKEVPTMDASPLPPNVLMHLEEVLGKEFSVLDYSAGGNFIDEAIQTLDESLPNGQLVRSSLALAVLKYGVEQLERWMVIKGYVSSYEIAAAWCGDKVKPNDQAELKVDYETGNVFCSRTYNVSSKPGEPQTVLTLLGKQQREAGTSV